jgi:hypothetical protein
MHTTIAALSHTPIAYKKRSATVELCFWQLRALCDPFDSKKDAHLQLCAFTNTFGCESPF